MISVLSLVVAILAVVGPLVARANTQRQIRAAARETWMREFRQHAAEMLRGPQYDGFIPHLRVMWRSAPG